MTAHFSARPTPTQLGSSAKFFTTAQRKDTFLKVKNEMQRPLSLRMMVLAFAYLFKKREFFARKTPNLIEVMARPQSLCHRPLSV